MRIIASMTTVPSRIDQLGIAIESVLAQTVSVECLELNIPYYCIRTGESYYIPPWLECMPRVKIFRTDDYGPITKVAPTFLRHQNDDTSYIWSVDDDFFYPDNQLEILYRAHRPDKRRILTRYGGKLNADGTTQNWYGEADVTWLEGFGGVLYPPACVGEDFLDYLMITSNDDACRKSDDIVLSMYFSLHKMPIHLYNKPSKDTPYMALRGLSYSKKDALTQSGHVNNYKHAFAFIKSFHNFQNTSISR